MKVTLQLDDKMSSVEDPRVVFLPEALQLMEQVLRGVGFSFKGQLEIVEDYDEGVDNTGDKEDTNESYSGVHD